MNYVNYLNIFFLWGGMITFCGELHATKSPIQLAAVNSSVWIDTNENGIFDKQEHGLAGVQVRLINQEGILVAETFSDNTGHYQFAKVKPAMYALHFQAPQGYEPKLYTDAFANLAGTNKINVLGATEFFTLKKGEKLQSYTIPFQKSRAGWLNIYNCIWEDANENEHFDIGERALEEVTVILYNEKGKRIAQTSTDKNGTYGFWGLKNAAYHVAYYYPANIKGATEPSDAYEIIAQPAVAAAKTQELLSFKAENANRQTLLRWEVEPSSRVKYFELWRSTQPNQHFEELINVIPAEKGEKNTYLEYDRDANLILHEKCYYRLKMVYEGGLSQWSEVLPFSPDVAYEPIHLMVYPSKDETDMYINYRLNANYHKICVQISDAQGNKRYQSSLTQNAITGQLDVDISEWEGGVYQVLLKADDEKIMQTCVIP